MAQLRRRRNNANIEAERALNKALVPKQTLEIFSWSTNGLCHDALFETVAVALREVALRSMWQVLR